MTVSEIPECFQTSGMGYFTIMRASRDFMSYKISFRYINRDNKSNSTLYFTVEYTKLFSQNHRMLGVGRDLCGSSSPTLLLKQGHLQQAAQDLVQEGLEYLQRRRLHNLPGQPVPVLCHPQLYI